MTETSKPDKIRQLLAAIQTGDQATSAALLHPDITIHEPESLPYAGSFSGDAGMGNLFQGMGAAWSEFNPAIDFILGEPSGDMFAVMYNIGFRSRATDRAMKMRVFELFRFQDGRIAEITPFHWDTKALAELCVK